MERPMPTLTASPKKVAVRKGVLGYRSSGLVVLVHAVVVVRHEELEIAAVAHQPPTANAKAQPSLWCRHAHHGFNTALIQELDI
eukprot:845226-Pyramimonas_sp.AAC.1